MLVGTGPVCVFQGGAKERGRKLRARVLFRTSGRHPALNHSDPGFRTRECPGLILDLLKPRGWWEGSCGANVIYNASLIAPDPSPGTTRAEACTGSAVPSMHLRLFVHYGTAAPALAQYLARTQQVLRKCAPAF